jgi:hypothetical protein
MKFCGNCGKEVKATAKFCPHCGTPAAPAAEEPVNAAQPLDDKVQNDAGAAAPEAAAGPVAVKEQSRSSGTTEPANPPAGSGVKKRLPQKALIAAAVVVVLAVALFIGAGAMRNSPTALIGTSLANTIKSLQTSNEGALGVVTNVLSGGSIEVSADLSEWDILYGSVPLTSRIKLYTDAADRKFAAEMSLSYDGERPIDATIYGSPDAVVFGSDSLLKGKYGINLKKAAANLEKSVFAPDSGTYFALDEYTYEMLHALLDSAQDYKDLEKDLTALSEKYLELLVKTACDVGETEKENVTLDIGSDKVKTTAVTLTLDTDAMAEIVLSLAEEASKDKQLRDTVKELVLLNSSALSGFNPYGYYYGYSMPDEDEINEQIDEFFENLLEEAEYVAEEIEDAGNVKLVLEFFVTKDGKTLAAFTMKGKEGSKTAFSMSLTLGKRLGSSEEISLKINDGWSDTVIRYTVSENTKTDYSARFTVQDGYSSMNVKISWNKSDGSYRVSSDEFELRGTLKQSGKKTTITVREISVDGYSMDIDLTVVLNENESVPSPGSYTDVLTVSERQIEDLVEDVSERLMESALFSLMRYL